MHRASLFVLFFLIATGAKSAEVVSNSVEREDGKFVFSGEFIIDRPVEAVRDLAAQHDRVHEFSPSVVESEVVEENSDGSLTRRMQLRSCIAVFCIEPEIVERVETESDGSIHTEVLPGRGDFESGSEEWHFEAIKDNRTLISFEGQRRADFALPPSLGDFLVRRRARAELLQTAQRMEDAIPSDERPTPAASNAAQRTSERENAFRI